MKLSELLGSGSLREERGSDLAYPCSDVADPAITADEARRVDLAQDTTLCRWHHGEHTHMNVDGRVYFCPIGRMFWRYKKQLSEVWALPPLRYDWEF